MAVPLPMKVVRFVSGSLLTLYIFLRIFYYSNVGYMQLSTNLLTGTTNLLTGGFISFVSVPFFSIGLNYFIIKIIK